MMKKNEKKLF